MCKEKKCAGHQNNAGHWKVRRQKVRRSSISAQKTSVPVSKNTPVIEKYAGKKYAGHR